MSSRYSVFFRPCAIASKNSRCSVKCRTGGPDFPVFTRLLSKASPSSVSLDVDEMLLRQANEPYGGVCEDETTLGCAYRGVKEHLAVIGEADFASVEGCVPEGREEEAVVDVEAVGVAVAFGPRHDVRGAEKGWIGDSGHRAAVPPIFDQRLAENVLADALDDEPLGLRGARHPADFLRKACSGASGRLTPRR